MSGTSVDGLDAALVRFAQDPETGAWTWTLQSTVSWSYPESLRSSLWRVMETSAEDLMRLDKAWATWAASKVGPWLAGQQGGRPHVLGSHGHTVFHRPAEGWTFQIGCGATLHEALQLPVVNDLRRLDVASGGQGAPLVPMADRDLFGSWDVALNLGGFANLSMDVPDRGRVAWDVGPANLLLNRLVEERGLEMDRDGALSRAGQVLPGLLETWKSLPHHAAPPPKSLGREWLEREVWPVALQTRGTARLEDVLATAVAYTSWAVARDVPDKSRVLVTGGGAFNPALMDGISEASRGRGIDWIVPDREVVEGKEALVFAWLGLLRWLGLPNALPSVTGARSSTSGGALWGPGPVSV
ncbi:MAG: anhydro-N-acetylmuramic acid kinase [Bacteroidetes bacterium]|nr:anhydro-N-acetylmuramic acid kinase [Bacteroidota bacterium]MDA0902915.1 anhydro-N-acetylmuramic acid kinase [Bacteroidota bacterium]MDA1241669.1 anhydro-N-acetylmuramic acid kinase [Bacteroidota bacterium]